MRRLLIFAYAFDETSQVFSHQIGVIQSLTQHFDQVVVIAAKVDEKELQTYSSDPHSKNRIIIIQVDLSRVSSQFRTLQKYLSLILFLRKLSFDAVFYFMTETSVVLFGTFFKVRRIRQVLWYAHAHKSLRLIIASLFVDLICSSTEGSMPLKSKKIRLIGQMVDEKMFQYSPKILSKDLTLIHYGRFDKSKNIGILIQVVQELLALNLEVRLRVIGSPSNQSSDSYQKQIIETYGKTISTGRVEILPACLRSQLSLHLEKSDIFLHAFHGSLDKSLVEATLVGVPVVTLNQEYLREFGPWYKTSDRNSVDLLEFLVHEVLTVVSMDISSLHAELLRRYKIALENHSLSNWNVKMKNLLLNSKIA